MNKNIKVLVSSLTISTIVYLIFIQFNVTKLHQLTKIDPLFYDPSLDAAELLQAIYALKTSEDYLLETTSNLLSKDTIENRPEKKAVIESIILNGILPLEYLEELTKNLERNETFIEKPNLINAFLLLIQNQKTANAYNLESTKLLSLATAATEAENSLARPHHIFLFGSKNTSIQEYKDLQLINKNSLVLQNDSATRWQCLLFGKKCDPKTIEKTEYKKSKPPTVTAKILPLEITMRNYKFDEIYGPYLVESSCFPKRYTWLQFVIDEHGRFIAKDATENYYLNLNNKIIAPSTQGSHLKERGVAYDYQNESTNYRCLDLRYWADLSSLAYLSKLLEDKAPTTTNELRKLESEYPDTFTFEQIITIDNKLTHLPYMLRTVASYLDVYTNIQKDHRSRLETLHLIANRSTYSLTYQTFSRSIWRLQEKPAYTSMQNLAVQPIYSTYTKLSEIYTKEEIAVFHE